VGWKTNPRNQGSMGAELSGFKVEQIKHALDNLPERPPNLIQFKSLCQHAPIYFEAQQLTYRPQVNQEKRAKLMEALK